MKINKKKTFRNICIKYHHQYGVLQSITMYLCDVVYNQTTYFDVFNSIEKHLESREYQTRGEIPLSG